MGWKFWQRNNDKDPSKIKLRKPEEMPEKVGRYLVVQEKMEPDVVWSLKCVLKPYVQGKKIYDFRLFDENSVSNAGVTIANYDSFDAHPELILFHGRFDKNSEKIEVHKPS